MLVLYYFSALYCLVTLCHGNPAVKPDKRQRPGSYYAITGATGGVHPRLEIRELQQDPVMWSVFLLALSEFQAIDQNERDSYYQIAGIHGMPWYDWDGVSTTDLSGPPNAGYCPHHDLLFSTWHRPYILLFEQKLQSLAIALVSGSDPSYEDAANRLRLPYWDWAQAVPSDEPVFPVALSTPRISVTHPNGTNGDIDNPLYDYDFHPLDRTQINSTGCNFGENPYICDNVRRTVRKATGEGRDVSDHAAIESDLRNQLNGLRQSVYSTITQYHSFNSLSNDGSRCGSQSLSIEVAHNAIHNAMDPGHMSPPNTAAFDPLFWLHHSNVDRQIALFQALFPETYVEQCVATFRTWTIQIGTAQDAQSPLTPFHRTTSGEWWTSANSRAITDLGYTYPELMDVPSNETLISRINALYRNSQIVAFDREMGTPVRDIEYIVQVTMPSSTQSSYNVMLFLGDVHDDPSRWNSQDSFISKTSSTVVMTTQGLSSTSGIIMLNEAIAARVEVGQLQQAQVVERLMTNLKWRLELGGAEIPRSDVPGVKVTLISTEVERATSESELDRWVGGFKVVGDIE